MEFGSEEYRELVRRHNPYLRMRLYGETVDLEPCPGPESPYQHILDIDDLDRPVYRVLRLDIALRGIRASELTLTRTRMWEDPFENFLLRGNVSLPDGTRVSLERIHEQYFGQCWTLNSESDAMWRIYSPDAKAIKLCTTVRKLFDAFYDHRDPKACVSQFLGLVRYLPGERIVAMMSDSTVANALLFDSSGVMQMRTLLVKRLGFSHEAELRLIRRYDKERPECALDHPPFHVDWSQVFDELVIDPRTETESVGKTEAALREAGYTGRVSQSLLYRLPVFEFVIRRPWPPGAVPTRVWDRSTWGD